MVKDIKIVFFGTPSFAIPVLKELLGSKYNVVAAFTANGPIEFEAKERGIKVFKPTSLKKDLPAQAGEKVFEQFKILNPDLCIVAAYGKIIPPRYLEIPKYGFLNVHPSLLPKYRGPSPVQTAILNGDTETGASIMLVDSEVDHGPILASAKYIIPKTKYNVEIATEVFELGAKLLVEILPKYIDGKLRPREQDHGQATFTKMFSRENGRINWGEPAEKIYNQIRALNPEPGTWTLLRSSGTSEGQAKIINIKKAELRDGKINIQTIQIEGKKEMPFKEFLNGYPDFDISQLE